MNSTTRSPRIVALQNPGTCDVNFFDFALPVAFGSLAGFLAGLGARALMSNERHSTQDAAAAVAHAIGFWTFGGLTWVLRQRRPHH